MWSFAWDIIFPFFCPTVITILDVKVCFLDATEGWILFGILFVGELRLLMLRDINELCLFITAM